MSDVTGRRKALKEENELTPSEDGRGWNAPAVYVDAFATTLWRGHIRLMCGEWGTDEKPYVRAAFVLETNVARQLILTLQEAIDDVENTYGVIPERSNETPEEK